MSPPAMPSGRWQRALAACGAVLLIAAWAGPLPEAAHGLFAAHMAMHVTVISVAAPLLAAGIGGTRLDPLRRPAGGAAPVAASLTEFVVVWAWHAPVLHATARSSTFAFATEQALFLGAGLWVWLSAFGGPARDDRRRAAGAGALLFTSMHMTLLGVLLALTPRPLYGQPGPGWGLDAIQDQHLGGVIMLSVAGTSYLTGALVLLAGLLRTHSRGEKP